MVLAGVVAIGGGVAASEAEAAPLGFSTAEVPVLAGGLTGLGFDAGNSFDQGGAAVVEARIAGFGPLDALALPSRAAAGNGVAAHPGIAVVSGAGVGGVGGAGDALLAFGCLAAALCLMRLSSMRVG
ncbi:MAG: hypothetical protein AAGE90_17225 [Pseudomonadota bacterium]